MSETITSELRGLGLDPDFIVNQWEGGLGNKGQAIENNLKIARQVGALDKRALPYLSQELGIIHFSRYPSEVLLDQLDQSKDSDRVLWANPHKDPNGEFYRFVKPVESLYKSLGERGVRLRLVELGSNTGQSSTQVLQNIKSRDGRFSGLVVGGHGSVEEVEFGDGVVLSTADLRSPNFVQVLKGLVRPEATAVFVSCFTGKEGGVAQEASKALGIEVTAPIYRTSLDFLRADFTGGDLRFRVQYTHEPSMRFRDYPLRGEKNTFVNGQLKTS